MPEIKSIPDHKRNPNPILDDSWKRVDKFRGAPQLADNVPLRGSDHAVIETPEELALRPMGGADDDEDNMPLIEMDGRAQSEEPIDDEWEYEEDEVYVTLDLGTSGLQHLTNMDCAMTALDSKKPFIKIGRSLHQGEWDEMIGTDILLYDHKGIDGRRKVKPLANSTTVTRHIFEPSTTQYRIICTPMGRKDDVQEEQVEAKNPLAGFKHFPELANIVDKARKDKKKVEKSEATKWEHRVEAALKRREKLLVKANARQREEVAGNSGAAALEDPDLGLE